MMHDFQLYLGHVSIWAVLLYLQFSFKGAGSLNIFTWIILAAMVAIPSCGAHIFLFGG